MLIHDFREIGNWLYAVRKRLGLTQMDVRDQKIYDYTVSTRAGLSLRTYADIERGTVNMRVETALQICEALHITPDEIFARGDAGLALRQEELFARLAACAEKDRDTARLLEVYLKSLDEGAFSG